MDLTVEAVPKCERSTRALVFMPVLAILAGACSSSPPIRPDGGSAGAAGGAAGADGGRRSAGGGAAGADGDNGQDSGNDDVHCLASCPVPFVVVDVPTDRVKDVLSVVGTASCPNEGATITGGPPGEFIISVNGGVGTCRITVSFLSHAPDFATDVQVIPSPGPCCRGQPGPKVHVIDIPEVGDADAGLDAPGDGPDVGAADDGASPCKGPPPSCVLGEAGGGVVACSGAVGQVRCFEGVEGAYYSCPEGSVDQSTCTCGAPGLPSCSN